MVDISTIHYDAAAAAGRQQQLVGTRQKGVLILADISGYTGLLTSAELATATTIVVHIIERVFAATTPTFVVNEIEGDALFTFAVESPVDRTLFKETLIQLEAYADAFYHAMDELRWSDIKDDQTLRTLVSNISMKFVVHYGTFELRQIGSFVKLIGPDVILAHRLLKNAVASDSYFLFTHSFLSLGDDLVSAKSQAHIEEIKHFGAVDVGFRTFHYDEEHQARHGSDHDHLTQHNIKLG